MPPAKYDFCTLRQFYIEKPDLLKEVPAFLNVLSIFVSSTGTLSFGTNAASQLLVRADGGISDGSLHTSDIRRFQCSLLYHEREFVAHLLSAWQHFQRQQLQVSHIHGL